MHGIHTIDTGFGRPTFDAAYLVVEHGRGAFIDSGTTHSLPRFLEAIQAADLEPKDIDWVILTHVHLDHAGGAGQLMKHLPYAKLAVHPRGARHMIDPSALIAGAAGVYGEEEVRRSYGEIVAVPTERVVEAGDGFVVDLAGRALLCLDTPGHARHHIAIHDDRAQAFFTGDIFGLSYRELDSPGGAFIIPTTSPVQFEPAAAHQSIDRMLGFEPEAMFLTHYGRVTEVARLANDLHEVIDAMVVIAKRHAASADRQQRIETDFADLYVDRAQHQGVTMPREDIICLLKIDIRLNAQGIIVWLDRGAH
ncbi:MBL fold metallo-hydrolase [Luteibacter rhizovicinus DSM 16549]|uniref:MBL fold metallo-hydrolase n=1 Tax=Luteibacter rhizovicinus DSM 16549 TaxID=1440763 RepID=A0A0G9H529_9GAMM|nr:MBL fold metallo-hydrolase [Luteibacter rhizovicinus]APG05747.1 MBL fold metallo-hydrolase [Luteibacter rhizovicinus DSM 16549]KLD64601.1 beta-lactamase [Luteibacter rhizovicinus DSM 16549]KLD74764.1 beta-lactamase [Xanthomonas hyacinthi DSM 19077]